MSDENKDIYIYIYMRNNTTFKILTLHIRSTNHYCLAHPTTTHPNNPSHHYKKNTVMHQYI